MKGVILLDVTLNLWNAKYQPKTSLLYINILYNHPQIIIKNLPGNISKRINTLSADETRFNKFKDLYNALAIFAGIIKIITKSFKKIFKFTQEKLKELEIMYQDAIYICSSWYIKIRWFLAKKCWCHQNCGNMSRGSYIFLIFLIIVGYVWQILGKGDLFAAPSHPWAALKMPILNRVNPPFILMFQQISVKNSSAS